jgi:hypothetical protein
VEATKDLFSPVAPLVTQGMAPLPNTVTFHVGPTTIPRGPPRWHSLGPRQKRALSFLTCGLHACIGHQYFSFFPVKRELISCKIYIFMELINQWPYFILIIDSLINASVQVMITALWNYKQALIN